MHFLYFGEMILEIWWPLCAVYINGWGGSISNLHLRIGPRPLKQKLFTYIECQDARAARLSVLDIYIYIYHIYIIYIFIYLYIYTD